MIRSLPLRSAGRPARRGALAALVQRPSGQVTLVMIAGLTRDGEIRTYRPVATPQDWDVPVARAWRQIDRLVDVEPVDHGRAIAIAQGHTYPGHPDSPCPWESLREAREALRPARIAEDPPIPAEETDRDRI